MLANTQELRVPTHGARRRASPWVHILCWIAKRAWRQREAHGLAEVARTTDESRYRKWRLTELRHQLTKYFDHTSVAEKDVMDFCCGTGELSTLLSEHRPRSLLGVDLSETAIANARKVFEALPTTAKQDVSFVRSQSAERIPAPSASVDLMCCFDAVEHLSDLGSVVREWFRVLRPGGRVWIWWSPWRGPYGHHLDSLLPIPWVHLLFSPRTLFAVCAELYDDSEFVPRKWDIDSQTGAKKPNKWRTTSSFRPFLNMARRHHFEDAIETAGLIIDRCEVHGFGGSRASRLTRILLPVPSIGECFVSSYVYELRKPVRIL